MDAYLAHFGSNCDINDHIEEVNSFLDSTPFMERNKCQPMPEILISPVPTIIVPPKLDLKPLLDTLKYSFLGPSKTLPFIIASDLDTVKEEEVVKCPSGQ